MSDKKKEEPKKDAPAPKKEGGKGSVVAFSHDSPESALNSPLKKPWAVKMFGSAPKVIGVVCVLLLLLLVWNLNKDSLGARAYGYGPAPTAPSEPITPKVIELTEEWSTPPVDITDGRGGYRAFNWYIEEGGRATEYEVRDANNPENVIPVRDGENVNTDTSKIARWQWRISGRVIKGPVFVKCTIGS